MVTPVESLPSIIACTKSSGMVARVPGEAVRGGRKRSMVCQPSQPTSSAFWGILGAILFERKSGQVRPPLLR
jgi:hypothetical protein